MWGDLLNLSREGQSKKQTVLEFPVAASDLGSLQFWKSDCSSVHVTAFLCSLLSFRVLFSSGLRVFTGTLYGSNFSLLVLQLL